MAAMKTDLEKLTTVEEGEPMLDDLDVDEAGAEAGEEGIPDDDDGDGTGDDAGAVAKAAGRPGEPGAKLAARFEAFGLRVRRSAGGRVTLGVEIELDLDEARPGALPEEAPGAAKALVIEEEPEGIEEAAPEPAGVPKAARPLRLSKNGAQFIGRFEGVRLRLYNDPAGHCTIGIGHLMHRGRCSGREPAEFKRGITRARAYAILQRDAARAASAVRKLRVPLNQRQFDALVSFTFNVGPAWTRKSKLRQALLARRYKDVPRELLRWVHAGGKPLPGLVRRRKAEGRLFSQGKYT